MKRKIIQVISENGFVTRVLCDDGTIWEIRGVDGHTYSKYSWKQIKFPNLPNTKLQHR